MLLRWSSTSCSIQSSLMAIHISVLKDRVWKGNVQGRNRATWYRGLIATCASSTRLPFTPLLLRQHCRPWLYPHFSSRTRILRREKIIHFSGTGDRVGRGQTGNEARMNNFFKVLLPAWLTQCVDNVYVVAWHDQGSHFFVLCTLGVTPSWVSGQNYL